MVYRVREGVHGEWCIDKGVMTFERSCTIARAATRGDGEAFVRELSRLQEPVEGSAVFSPSHDFLIGRVRALKQAVMSHLECGDRNFDDLLKTVAAYIDAQSAADALSEWRRPTRGVTGAEGPTAPGGAAKGPFAARL